MAYRLLLVEDDEDVRESLNRGLRSCGYDVEAQPSYHAGLRSARENVPDILVTDTQLVDPNFNYKVFYGFELGRQVRRLSKEAVIIGMSGHDASARLSDEDTTIAELYQQNGADAFLCKPVDLKDLESAIKKALSERQKEIFS